MPKIPDGIKKYLRKDSEDYVWWKNRRSSKNVYDGTQDKPDPMLNTNVVIGPFGGSSKKKSSLPDKVSVPPKRPKTHNNLITPGKWKTK